MGPSLPEWAAGIAVGPMKRTLSQDRYANALKNRTTAKEARDGSL